MGRHTIQCFIGRRAKPDVVKSILDDVPNLAKLKDFRGRTALHFAAHTRGRKRVTELLIAAGTDVNARDYEGETPLITASWWRGRGSAAALLANGAVPLC